MAAPAKITIDWGEADKDAAQRREWLTSWLVSEDGEEGEFLYDGVGGTVTTHEVPDDAVGVRFRWANQIHDPLQETRRQWFVPRKLYLFREQPAETINALDVCP